MDPVTGALVAGGLGVAGGIAEGYITSALGAHEARKNRQFQERMSSTSHQRETKDLLAAGLNPILSSKYGGSSTPPGATGQVGDFNGTAKGIAAAQAVGSLKLQEAQTRDLNAAAALKENDVNIKSQTVPEQLDTVREALYKLRNDADLSGYQYNLITKQIEKINQEIENLKLEEGHSAQDLHRKKVLRKPYEFLDKKVLPLLDKIKFPTGKNSDSRFRTDPRKQKGGK